MFHLLFTIQAEVWGGQIWFFLQRYMKLKRLTMLLFNTTSRYLNLTCTTRSQSHWKAPTLCFHPAEQPPTYYCVCWHEYMRSLVQMHTLSRPWWVQRSEHLSLDREWQITAAALTCRMVPQWTWLSDIQLCAAGKEAVCYRRAAQQEGCVSSWINLRV